jgi:hypothetical protein
MEKKIEPKMPKMELQPHISELIDLDKVKSIRELLAGTRYALKHFDDLMVQIRETLEGFGVNTDK